MIPDDVSIVYQVTCWNCLRED